MFLFRKASAKRDTERENYAGRKIAVVAGGDGGKWSVVSQ